MNIRNRIKELRQVNANELLPNPKNWREHPTRQTDALRGVLSQIGFADAVLVRETPEGLMLLDGHARTEIVGDCEIPVLVLDQNDEEADLLLATLDPLAAMADSNADALAELLPTLEAQSEAVKELLDGLAKQNGIFDELPADADGKEFNETIGDEVEMITCPHCGEQFPK